MSRRQHLADGMGPPGEYSRTGDGVVPAMSNPSRRDHDLELLAIKLDSASLRVSYLSSLLRVVQAALREVARNDEETRRQFQRPPAPVLEVYGPINGSPWTLLFAFTNPKDSAPLGELSSRTFDAFLDRFSGYVLGLPQPGLWGGAALRAPKGPFELELARRMDQVYRELRRAPKATLSFRQRTIEIEGNRMEIQ